MEHLPLSRVQYFGSVAGSSYLSCWLSLKLHGICLDRSNHGLVEEFLFRDTCNLLLNNQYICLNLRWSCLFFVLYLYTMWVICLNACHSMAAGDYLMLRQAIAMPHGMAVFRSLCPKECLFYKFSHLLTSIIKVVKECP